MHSAREKNIAIAKEAIAYCRRIIPVQRSFTHPSVTDKHELKLLCEETLGMREDIIRYIVDASLVRYFLMYPDSYTETVKKTTRACKLSHAGCCGELSELAANFSRKKNVKRIEKVSIVGKDHEFLIMDREGDINDVNTWGPSCVVLDVLNAIVAEPCEIYDRITGYRFDETRDNPHIIYPFTPHDQLKIVGEITCRVNAFESRNQIYRFYNITVNLIKECCRIWLDENSCKKMTSQIDHMISDMPKYNEFKLFTNFDMERFLDKKVKKILACIEKESKGQSVFTEILIRILLTNYKQNALHKAVEMQLPEIVNRLLRYRNDPDEFDADGYSAHHLAAMHDSPEILVMILNHWKNENIDNKNAAGYTALQIAAADGKYLIVQELLNRGADSCIRNSSGWTILHYAARDECADIVNLILDHGLNDINETKDDGWTALHLAAENNSLSVAKTLLDFDSSACINEQVRNDGITALHLAALHGYIEMADELLKRGADIFLQDRYGNTALHYAALKNKADIIELILWYNRRCINKSDKEGYTALHVAVEDDNYDAAEALLDGGADVDLANKAGLLPLHLAAKWGHINILERILQADFHACINEQTKKCKCTALYIAVENGHLNIVEALLKYDADVHVKNRKGKSALMLARELQNAPMIELFERHMANAGDIVSRRPGF